MIAEKKQRIKELNMQQHFPLQLDVGVGQRNVNRSECATENPTTRCIYSNYVKYTSDFLLV